DGGPADRQLGRHLAHGHRTVGEELEDPAPGGVAQGPRGLSSVRSHKGKL
ncbi:MAG: hypothetical protein JWO68_2682, partial [Actinomycetia bacterium]|nr:hypothetical protein [Actinomycetes bacterium]